MFSTSEQLTRALWALCEAQVSALTQYANAAIEAGVNAAEVNVDAALGALASNTVLTRQWLGTDNLPLWPAVPRAPESQSTLGHTGLQLEQ